MPSKIALDIIFDIEDELTDHSCFECWWQEIDNNTRKEIRVAMRKIVDSNIERAASLIKDANSQLDFISNEEN
tara:strand:+ start:3009 stop:3227 length:219 start_codon:yes stop_codon:yes gene_type:complete